MSDDEAADVDPARALPYLCDPEDGVPVDVEVWRVGDAQQDLHTVDRKETQKEKLHFNP